jgi:hypothetical protein
MVLGTYGADSYRVGARYGAASCSHNCPCRAEGTRGLYVCLYHALDLSPQQARRRQRDESCHDVM